MPIPKPLPPFEFLDENLTVDPTSPSGLRWKKDRKFGKIKAGFIAGYKRKSDNYWVVSLRFDKKCLYMAHRIVYFLCNKVDPANNYIDHQTCLANTKDNLRVANASENQWNKNKPNTYGGKETSSKYKGVYWDKSKKRWHASIQYKNKPIFIGFFFNEVEAAQAYNEAASKHFGEYARLNAL